ncbi:MAG: enoyl-CoA hydratase/isomerase family protein [Rhodospirillaceae bacterium]|jgi:enoyl-CoA hydratase|nr:enoyl-CoA hydratase/isomerase family protein [Rhodospirillaceae bacterium]MBT5945792.1 enoyl-CoA hydratase/isomerase family protein [Rhodospirillaceae bacterium]MBT6403324.1 enoyl-CoA hydratase/isomerase family protein [Rhodospirillaceae bacterium]MBT6536891.1 enoyl-CoA hydratase/isomerase family protein [Rhodospirillaceae bacterium]MBT7360384.1 enoyl-CoA hydratase/isomerase family protein [Rhodospirillaceae bacterium]
MNDEPEVLLEQRGRIGLITLNKPKALNALSLSMIHAIAPQLEAWAADDGVDAVVIQGTGDKAFCAGGDIRDLYEGRGTDFGPTYYAAEYKLNVMIHTFPKPYIALMDGVTMGGGVGMSVHGSHRVVSDRILFAMPETGIGLFPDIGASWFLPCCPGEIGMYLGLTGHRLRAADTLYAGIGDVHVPADRDEDLIAALVAATTLDGDGVADILRDFAVDPGEAPLAAHRDAIDRCFAGDSVEDILARLAAEDSDWARTQIETLASKSPTALKVTHRQLRLGARIESIADIMAMEYRLADRSFRGHDLFEGIRAVVIDKDGAPQWDPATLDAVSDADVDDYFEPVAGEPSFG